MSQDCETLRWSTITLLSDPAAKIIRMKVHVFTDSTSCVGVTNPDPSNNWATAFDGLWNVHGFDEQLNLTAREIPFFWHMYLGAHTGDMKRNVQKYLNGQAPESFDARIIFMSMFNKERHYRNLFAQRQRIGSICCTNQTRTLVPPGAASEKMWWNGTLHRPTVWHRGWLTYSIVTLSHPVFPATAPMSRRELKKGGRHHHFQGTLENKQEEYHIGRQSTVYSQLCLPVV